MPLNTPTKMSAVIHWGIIPQGPSELCKFTEVLCFEPKSMRMAGEELEIADFCLGNFEVECLLPLLLMVIIGLIFCWLGLCRETRCVQSQCEMRDFPVIKFFGYHSILLDVFQSSLKDLFGVRYDTFLIGPIANKE